VIPVARKLWLPSLVAIPTVVARPSADHRVGVRLRRRRAGEPRRAVPDGPEQRPLAVLHDAGLLQVGSQALLQAVMTGHGVRLAALLAQPHPQSAVPHEHVLDLHGERRANPRKAENHQRDQRPVTQADLRRDIDSLEQRPRFRRLRDGSRCPTNDNIPCLFLANLSLDELYL